MELRSLTLKVWREKIITLESTRKLLLVFNRENKKKERTLDLSQMTIEWVGQKGKNHFCFMVHNTAKTSDERDYLFGYEDY
jgi:hypothetical protein